MVELFIIGAVSSATPILLATLGEIITERSGILNLGVEGMMLVGALSGFAAARLTGNAGLGLLAAMISAGLISLIHAFLSVSLRTNQVVSGLGLTIFGIGLTGYFGKSMIGVPAPVTIGKLVLPVISEIPFFGNIFFKHDPLVYTAVILVPLCYWFLFRTRAGLHLRAVGDNPAAADMAGINVQALRYGATFAGGMLCGLGGIYISLVYTPFWAENMIAGRGWIAIALVIFSSWDPRLALMGALLFGGVDVLATRIQALGVDVPPYFLRMLPYAFTITILILTTARRAGGRGLSAMPASLTLPYEREA
ncbi:MAG: ABC transporter permease [Thermodesulfobacteriota bacterium]